MQYICMEQLFVKAEGWMLWEDCSRWLGSLVGFGKRVVPVPAAVFRRDSGQVCGSLEQEMLEVSLH